MDHAEPLESFTFPVVLNWGGCGETLDLGPFRSVARAEAVADRVRDLKIGDAGPVRRMLTPAALARELEIPPARLKPTR